MYGSLTPANLMRALMGSTAERVVLDPLVAPFLRTKSLDVKISGSALADLFASVDGLPASVRTTTGTVYNHSGQIAGEEHPCPISGNQGWYVEFADSNYRAGVSVTISGIGATWVPNQGLRVTIHAGGTGYIGTVHWHGYYCLGGGVGGNAGPASCQASGNLAALVTASWGGGGKLTYSLALGTSGLSYGCHINMGSLPDLVIGWALPPVDSNLSGSVDLPVRQEGSIRLPLPGGDVERKYRLNLISPQVGAGQTGFQAATDVTVTWIP